MIVLLLLLTACGEATSEENDPLENAERWTLEEDLRIDEGEDYFLSRIEGIDVADDGRIFITDIQDSEVKVFSPEGELVETVGRAGQGPGEFSSPRYGTIGPGDSLYVLSGLRTLSVFAPNSYEFDRRVEVQAEGMTAPLRVHAPMGDGFLVEAFVTGQGEDAPMLYHMPEMGHDLEVIDIPQRKPDRVRVEGTGVEAPFSRELQFDLGPDGRLYHGITDSLAVTISDADGRQHDHWSLPVEPAPITEERREAEIDMKIEDTGTIAEGREDALREGLAREDTSQTMPAFSNLLVDDERRVWLSLDSERYADQEWLVATHDGEVIARAISPQGITIKKILNGYAYGVTASMDEIPAVVRYRIHE